MPDDDDTWFHPVTYDQTEYPDIAPDLPLDAYLARDESLAQEARPARDGYRGLGDETVPDLPLYYDVARR